MPTVVTSDVKPTFIEKPDMRFATTFLSYKYRDYAVQGESLMDKATGEIFTKRPHDGRVVSFFQNKKYLHDVCLELCILLSNYLSFEYDYDSTEGFYVSADYDSMSIKDEQRVDILTSDFVVPNIENETTTEFKFRLSKKTNGFFFRATTRDSDKALVEFLTNEYNTRMKGYEGGVREFREEAARFEDNARWEDSNAVLEYTVKVTDENDNWRVYTEEVPIRLNEKTCIFIPYTKICVDFPDGYEECLVTVKAVTYHKLRFMHEHYNDFDDEFRRVHDELHYPDGMVHVDYYNVNYFIDDSSDIHMLNNDFIIALIDIPYLQRYLAKMTAFKNQGSFIVARKRPNPPLWMSNTVWAERVRDMYWGYEVYSNDTETDIEEMELRFGANVINGEISRKRKEHENFFLSDLTTISSYISMDITDEDAFYLGEGLPNIYTAEQFDNMLTRLEANISSGIPNMIVSTDGTSSGYANAVRKVNRNGLILNTLTTTESEDISGDDEEG